MMIIEYDLSMTKLSTIIWTQCLSPSCHLPADCSILQSAGTLRPILYLPPSSEAEPPTENDQTFPKTASDLVFLGDHEFG